MSKIPNLSCRTADKLKRRMLSYDGPGWDHAIDLLLDIKDPREAMKLLRGKDGDLIPVRSRRPDSPNPEGEGQIEHSKW